MIVSDVSSNDFAPLVLVASVAALCRLHWIKVKNRAYPAMNRVQETFNAA
jgi:hypothetical protein